MSSHGVEIAEEDDRPFLIGGGQVSQHLLHHVLGTTVGIGNTNTDRRFLGDGNGISTVNSSGGGEN